MAERFYNKAMISVSQDLSQIVKVKNATCKKDSHIGILYFEQLMDLTAIYIGH